MYFGKVIINDENTRCRIEVFCEIIEGAKLTIDEKNIEKNIGKTGKCFVPKFDLLALKNGEYIIFNTTPNPNPPIENHDSLYLDTNDYKNKKKPIFHLLTSKTKDFESLLFERFLAEDSRLNPENVYIIQNNFIFGRFKLNKDGSLTHLSNSKKVFRWEKEKLNNLIECRSKFFLVDYPKEENGEPTDFSTPQELLKWFKTHLIKHNKINHKQIIQDLTPILTEKSIEKEDSLDKQKLERVKSSVLKLEPEKDLLTNVWRYPEIQEHFKPLVLEILKDFKNAELTQINEELEQTKLNNKKILDDYKTEIENKKEELKKAESEKLRIEKSKEALTKLLKRFENERDNLITEMSLFQAFLPKTYNSTLNFKTSEINLPFEKKSESELIDIIANSFDKSSIRLSKLKVVQIKATLDLFKGIFVPNEIWSQIYCKSYPSFQRFLIVVEPSLKSINDLWKLYLMNIANVAIQNTNKTIVIHFVGVNNTIPEILLKCLHSLITERIINVPELGLLNWPTNIVFFFSPAHQSYAFNLTENDLKIWPGFSNEEVDDSSISGFPVEKENEAKQLAEKINALLGNAERDSLIDAKKILWLYPQTFKKVGADE